MNESFSEYLESEIMEMLISRFGHEIFAPGLDRTKFLYDNYIKSLKAKGTKTIIIAGTNGKGQTAHSLLHFFNQKKLNVALWTSPHILSIRERFCFSSNGNVSDIQYRDLKHCILESVQFIDCHFASLKISFYEFLFFIFLKLCNEKRIQLDYIILEVGLGGRFDSVNHFDADLTCITSISRDHQDLLGNRYDLILKEKLGITRPGIPLLTNFNLLYLDQIASEHCLKINAPWFPLNSNKKYSYLQKNLDMAYELAKYFYPKDDFDKGIVPVFKGRFETIKIEQSTFTFNGAHNTDGVRKLSHLLFEQNGQISFDEIWVSFSRRDVKEIEYMLKILLHAQKNRGKIILTTFSHSKAMDKSCLKFIFDKVFQENIGTLEFVENWKNRIFKCSNQKILVCGSYYFVGEVQRFLAHSFF